jgi:solute carrier family 25 carnitine/acylcarnitine transporter 20/29
VRIPQFRNEGPRGFFKGMASPLFGSAWTNAIMFGVYERSLRLLDPQPSSPSLRSVFGAGVIGGFCQTVALTPAELIKCRLQVQDGHENARYKGPVDCARHIYARHGLRGLFFGYSVTLWREVPTYGFYFFSYEYAKRKMLAHGVNENTAMLTAGGIAGVGSWTLAYPADGKPPLHIDSSTARGLNRVLAPGSPQVVDPDRVGRGPGH